MINNSRNIAVIPARGGSRRLPKKNFLDFHGKPLFLYTYEAAKESGLFSDIVISTDSKDILDICREKNIAVPFIRPEPLCSDTASLDDVCLHALDEMEKINGPYNAMCVLWATSPLRDATDLQQSYRMLTDRVDAVVGMVQNAQYYPSQIIDRGGYLQPLVPLLGVTNLRAQDVPSVYVDNGSLAWVKTDAFRIEKTWMPKRTKGYLMPTWKSVDVATQQDLELLSFYFEKHISTTHS